MSKEDPDGEKSQDVKPEDLKNIEAKTNKSRDLLIAGIGAVTAIICAIIGSPYIAPIVTEIIHGEDTFSLKIGSPSGCEDSDLYIPVYGTSSGNLPSDKSVWIMVGPRDSPGDWYPQGKDHLSFANGDWNTRARIGGEGDGDNQKRFDIRAVLVDRRTDEQYQEWINEGDKAGYPPLRMPQNARTLDQVTVIRTNKERVNQDFRPEVKITNPRDGSTVSFDKVEVTGSISGAIPPGNYLWLLVNPKNESSMWYPQDRVIIELSEEKWRQMAALGSKAEFYIGVAIVDETTNKALASHQNMELPVNASILDQIKVSRV